MFLLRNVCFTRNFFKFKLYLDNGRPYYYL